MDFLTADLCDEFSDRLQILAPGYAAFGGHARFAGRIATLKVFEDNSRVREMLSEPGEGRVDAALAEVILRTFVGGKLRGKPARGARRFA